MKTVVVRSPNSKCRAVVSIPLYLASTACLMLLLFSQLSSTPVFFDDTIQYLSYTFPPPAAASTVHASDVGLLIRTPGFPLVIYPFVLLWGQTGDAFRALHLVLTFAAVGSALLVPGTRRPIAFFSTALVLCTAQLWSGFALTHWLGICVLLVIGNLLFAEFSLLRLCIASFLSGALALVIPGLSVLPVLLLVVFASSNRRAFIVASTGPLMLAAWCSFLYLRVGYFSPSLVSALHPLGLSAYLDPEQTVIPENSDDALLLAHIAAWRTEARAESKTLSAEATLNFVVWRRAIPWCESLKLECGTAWGASTMWDGDCSSHDPTC